MLMYFINLSRLKKMIIFLIFDFFVISFSYWLALSVRLDHLIKESGFFSYQLIILNAIVTIFIFAYFGLYRMMIRAIGSKLFLVILLGGAISSITLFLLSYFFSYSLPRSVVFIYFIVLCSLLFIARLLSKSLILGIIKNKRNAERVVIYGAGESGRQLLTALNLLCEYQAVAFVDDNQKLQNTIVNNLRVFSPDMIGMLMEKYDVKKVLLAIPSSTQEIRNTIYKRLEPLGCTVLTTPGMRDLVDGKITLNSLKAFSVIDLLGRDPVEPDINLMNKNIKDQVVMVTGAGGSIGSELCRQILSSKPDTLILFEMSEFNLYQIEKELSGYIKNNHLNVNLVALLGSVKNKTRLTEIMDSYAVDTIYHAAAYKHVPIIEYNTIEGVENNILGTLYCAEVAMNKGVKNFVLVSTDKAVRPTNIMGTTKRVAELILQALSNIQSNTCFCMVRFGNVLGSSGSVIPLFEKQIMAGGPITLTDKEITRYFMTIPEAAQLVIQAGAMGKGGDVFVLDMGKPVRIYDLAKQMILLSGLQLKDENNLHGDIEIRVSGLRPGEKLYEELLVGDDVQKTSHARIMTANEIGITWEALCSKLNELEKACLANDQEKIRAILLSLPTAFSPGNEISDLVWCKKTVLIEHNG